MKQRTSFVLALLLAVPFAVPAQTPPITESMGVYHTPEQKAIEAYGRGMKAKRKAEAETDPAKQTKLYRKAKEELSRSAGYQPNYDAYIALGQVYLALGMKESALDACTFAQALKPNAEAAKSCIEQAQQEIQDAAATKPAGG